MLTIEYCLTENEFLDYNYYTGWQGPGKRKHRLKYYLTSLFAFAAMMIVLFYRDGFSNIRLSSIVMIFIGLITLFLLIRYRIRAVFDKQAIKLIEQSGRNSVLSQTVLTLNENGVFGKTNVAEVKYSWNAFQKKIFVNNCYYLYINIRQALVIPERAFKSSKEKQEFDQMLLAHFPLQAALNTIENEGSGK